MKSFKKILSIILIANFSFVSTLSLSVLAEDDYCAKNSKGGFIHADCADDELLKVGFYKTADFVDIENLGWNADEERYAFNFRALDEVFEKKKLISTKDLDDQYDLLNKNCHNPVDIWTKENVYYIISAGLIGAITGLFGFKTSKNQDPINDISIDQRDLQQVPTSHSKTREFSSLIRGVIGTVIGAVATITGLKIKNEKNKRDTCNQSLETLNKLVELDNQNESKARMLNSLLYHLERPELLTEHLFFDMVNYVSRPNTAGSNDEWNPSFAGINYTKEERESFPQKFKEVAIKIRKNLEENHKLNTFMNFPYSPYNEIHEESCINCPKISN